MKIEFDLAIKAIATIFGVDPGTTHLGLAEVWPNSIRHSLYQVTLERHSDPIQRMSNIGLILSTCFSAHSFKPTMIIEGAAYGIPYRQVELAEIRATAVCWCNWAMAEPKIVPPSTIRKAIFGNAKIKTHEFWPELAEFPDAAAALSCALYATKEEE